MAIFTKKGKRFDTTGRALYGPVNTNNVFKGFGGACEARNNGDAVVRYDQLADRWLIVMPIFSRGPVRPDQPAEWKSGPSRVYVSPPGSCRISRAARRRCFEPPRPHRRAGTDGSAADAAAGRAPSRRSQGPYSMCYAISAGADPFGPYYRYEFLRPLFPDYPRPAIWPDGYYVPTSTGDEVIQKHVPAATAWPRTSPHPRRRPPPGRVRLVVARRHPVDADDREHDVVADAGARLGGQEVAGAVVKNSVAFVRFNVWTLVTSTTASTPASTRRGRRW